MNRFLHFISGFSVLSAAAALCACSMMTEDLSDCPKGLNVRFVYDYNTARADMFKDHVGHVKLYVYDENGNKVAEQSVSNTPESQPLAQYGYTMHFPDGTLPDGRYRLQAVAMQRDWEEAENTPGAKYRKNDPQRHDELFVTLDHDHNFIDGTHHFRVSGVAPLDTLWHTLRVTSDDPTDGIAVPPLHKTQKPYSVYPLEDQYVTVQHSRATYATVSLVRNTKHINVALHQLDEHHDHGHTHYEVYITDCNTDIKHDNEVVPSDTVRYEPYNAWTTRFDKDGIHIEDGTDLPADSAYQRTAHYNFMTNRLVYNDTDHEKTPRLVVIMKNPRTQKVLDIGLSELLAQGRHAYPMANYSPQEYLDREYDYDLNLVLAGTKWKYVELTIDVLGWAKRTYNVDL